MSSMYKKAAHEHTSASIRSSYLHHSFPFLNFRTRARAVARLFIARRNIANSPSRRKNGRARREIEQLRRRRRRRRRSTDKREKVHQRYQSYRGWNRRAAEIDFRNACNNERRCRRGHIFDFNCTLISAAESKPDSSTMKERKERERSRGEKADETEKSVSSARKVDDR